MVQRRATSYELLGVGRQATQGEIRDAYERARRTLLRRQEVGTLGEYGDRAEQALAVLGQAWEELADPARRAAYDEGIGAPGDAAPPSSVTEGDRFADRPAPVRTGDSRADAVLAGIEEVADWLGPSRRPSRRVVVPDLRGQPVSDARYQAARAGMHTRLVQLAVDPAPVEGWVVNQEPAPGTTVARESTVVLDVLHPETDRP